MKADKIQDLESKSVEDWTSLCLEKRKRVQDAPSKFSQKQSVKKISKQVTQNLPPSMRASLIPDVSLQLPGIDWG